MLVVVVGCGCLKVSDVMAAVELLHLLPSGGFGREYLHLFQESVRTDELVDQWGLRIRVDTNIFINTKSYM